MLNVNLKQLRDRYHAGIPDEAEAIMARTKKEGRELTDGEVAQLEALRAEQVKLGDAITLEGRYSRGELPRQAAQQRDPYDLRPTPVQPWLAAAGGARTPSHKAERWALTSTGQRVPLLSPQESLADHVEPSTREHAAEAAQMELGELVRAQINGTWTPQISAMAGGTTVGGGVLLTSGVSARVIDLARARARVVQAGATTIPMQNRELTIAKVATNPTPAWRAENVPLPVGDVTFAGVNLRARTLGAIAKFPIELAEDAPNFGQLIEDILAEVLGVELDRVALTGNGAAEEPLGLQNVVGVNTITAVGVPAYADFSSAVQSIAEANADTDALALIVAPRTAGTMDRLVDTTNQPLMPPESYRNLKKLSTTQVPTNLGGGSNESLAFVGLFPWLWIGMRTELRIEASRHASDPSIGGSAFTDMQVWVRAYLRADVAVVRPNFFTVLSGITTS